MTATIYAPVTHLFDRHAAKPGRVPVCHYCLNEFRPTVDPQDGSLWDLDDHARHCCDACHCPTCLVGHTPDTSCPVSLEGDRSHERDDFAVFGDSDAQYDALVDGCLTDPE